MHLKDYFTTAIFSVAISLIALEAARAQENLRSMPDLMDDLGTSLSDLSDLKPDADRKKALKAVNVLLSASKVLKNHSKEYFGALPGSTSLEAFEATFEICIEDATQIKKLLSKDGPIDGEAINKLIGHLQFVEDVSHQNFRDLGTSNPTSTDKAQMSPIDTRPEIATKEFLGDNPEAAHAFLWSDCSDEIKTSLAAAHEMTEVVIVGGGMAGLLQTYRLRAHQPVLLEFDSRLGGNSKGESWQGAVSSVGATYTNIPAPGSSIAKFFDEIGMPSAKAKTTNLKDQPVLYNGKLIKNMWEEGLSATTKKQFVTLAAHFQKLDASAVPDINADGTLSAEAKSLSAQTIRTYLTKIVAEKLQKPVELYFNHYFRSAAGGDIDTVNALVGVSFFASDFKGIQVGVGGNAEITQKLFEAITQEVPLDHVRTGALVRDIRNDPKTGNALVTYIVGQGNYKTIEAKQVIVAMPKFLAPTVIPDLSPEISKAIRSTEYRAYVVANVLINKEIPAEFYDLPVLSDENEDHENSNLANQLTDVVYGNYSAATSGKTVLSVYIPLTTGDRVRVRTNLLYANAELTRQEIENRLRKEILPTFHIDMKNIADIRIFRYGHPLPVPSVATFKTNRLALLSAPFQKNIHFVGQDVWGIPAFESVFAQSEMVAERVQKLLEGCGSSAAKMSPKAVPRPRPAKAKKPTQT